MADITHLPTPDDLTVRATASLQAMHDRVVAEGGIDPFTNVILMFIRAIIAYLAIPLEQATIAIAESTPAPQATPTAINSRAHATHAHTRARRCHPSSKRALHQAPRARRSHPVIHPTTARHTTSLIPAPHRPNLLKIVPPH